MLKKIAAKGVWLLLISTVLLQAESLYGFGYEDEEAVDAPVSSDRTIAALKQQIAQQQERIDGLTTVMEGLSASVNELQQSRGTMSSTEGSAGASDDQLLKKLAAMIDEINANYVSKKELQEALGQRSAGVTSATKVSQEQNPIQETSNEALYSEGVRYFVKQRYDEAQKRFTITDKKGYKPAASNYYLGEIAYYTKKYEDAIFYFKKSAGLYDKASYIDTLLLHTAISLENTGDKGQARVFYENIIENYAGKKTANIAQDRLKRL